MPDRDTLLVAASFLGTIVGAIISFIGTYCGATNIANVTRRKEASANLIAAFNPTLVMLRIYSKRLGTKGNSPIPDINDFMDREIIKQAVAFENFHRFIPQKHQKDYKQAWDSYLAIVCVQVTNTVFDGLFDGSGNKQDYISKVEELIHKITSFTKYGNI